MLWNLSIQVIGIGSDLNRQLFDQEARFEYTVTISIIDGQICPPNTSFLESTYTKDTSIQIKV